MTTRIRRRGRPCGLTLETERVLLSAIERGLPYKQAAALAGISYMTLNRWRRQGEVDGAPAEFRDFCYRLEAAEARAANTLLQAVSKAGRERDWRAAAWILERRYPEDWGKRDGTLYPTPPLQSETEAARMTMIEEIGRENIAASFRVAFEKLGLAEDLGYVKAPVPAENATVAKSDVAPPACA